ncbi:PaaI family thioesterase [bacterium]|nr:PaaI family thioesterase [bacterium]
MSGFKHLQDDDYCFVCGRANPYGLKLSFDIDVPNKTVTTVFQPERRHQGWVNRLHGGILTAILDEVMVNAAYFLDLPAVTGQMSVRFRDPADTREKLIITGRIVETRAKFLKARAECRTASGKLIAQSDALLIRMPGGG